MEAFNLRFKLFVCIHGVRKSLLQLGILLDQNFLVLLYLLHLLSVANGHTFNLSVQILELGRL